MIFFIILINKIRYRLIFKCLRTKRVGKIMLFNESVNVDDCNGDDFNNHSGLGALVPEKRRIKLPIVIHKEKEEFVAECPILYVAGNGFTYDEAVKDVIDALKSYLGDIDVQKSLSKDFWTQGISFRKKDVINKATDLFKEYNPGEEVPNYHYEVICVSFFIVKQLSSQ